MTLKPFVLCVSLAASWALAQPRPESCPELTRWVQEEPYRRHASPGGVEGDPLYVVGSVVMVREGPAPTSAVLQKLGYGVQVGAVSRACGEWVLVSSPYGGYGFVREVWLHPEMSDVEDNSVLRTYRIVKGRVVQVGKLTPAMSRGDAGPLAWTTHRIVAWRDLDGDGRPDELTPCPYGSYCTQAKGFTR